MVRSSLGDVDHVQDVAKVDHRGRAPVRVGPVDRVPAVGVVAEFTQKHDVGAVPTAVVEHVVAGPYDPGFEGKTDRSGQLDALDRGSASSLERRCRSVHVARVDPSFRTEWPVAGSCSCSQGPRRRRASECG